MVVMFPIEKKNVKTFEVTPAKLYKTFHVCSVKGGEDWVSHSALDLLWWKKKTEKKNILSMKSHYLTTSLSL